MGSLSTRRQITTAPINVPPSASTLPDLSSYQKTINSDGTTTYQKMSTYNAKSKRDEEREYIQEKLVLDSQGRLVLREEYGKLDKKGMRELPYLKQREVYDAGNLREKSIYEKVSNSAGTETDKLKIREVYSDSEVSVEKRFNPDKSPTQSTQVQRVDAQVRKVEVDKVSGVKIKTLSNSTYGNVYSEVQRQQDIKRERFNRMLSTEERARVQAELSRNPNAIVVGTSKKDVQRLNNPYSSGVLSGANYLRNSQQSFNTNPSTNKKVYVDSRNLGETNAAGYTSVKDKQSVMYSTEKGLESYNSFFSSLGSGAVKSAERVSRKVLPGLNAVKNRLSVNAETYKQPYEIWENKILIEKGNRDARRLSIKLNTLPKRSQSASQFYNDVDVKRFGSFVSAPATELIIPAAVGTGKIFVDEFGFKTQVDNIKRRKGLVFTPDVLGKTSKRRVDLLMSDKDVQAAYMAGGFFMLGASGAVGAGIARGSAVLGGSYESVKGVLGRDEKRLGAGLFLGLSGRPIQGGKRVFVEIFGEKTPLESITGKDVNAKTTKESIKQFRQGTIRSRKVSSYDRIIIKKVSPNQPLPKNAELTSQDLVAIRQRVKGYITNPKTSVVHASPTLLKGQLKSGPKGSAGIEDPGLFVAPKGRANLGFAGLSKQAQKASSEFSLLPDFSAQPTVSSFFVSDVVRLPRRAINQPGFKSPLQEMFRAEARTRGEAVITKRGELGKGDVVAQLFEPVETVVTKKGTVRLKGQKYLEKGTRESEAIIPEGTDYIRLDTGRGRFRYTIANQRKLFGRNIPFTGDLVRLPKYKVVGDVLGNRTINSRSMSGKVNRLSETFIKRQNMSVSSYFKGKAKVPFRSLGFDKSGGFNAKQTNQLVSRFVQSEQGSARSGSASNYGNSGLLSSSGKRASLSSPDRGISLFDSSFSGGLVSRKSMASSTRSPPSISPPYSPPRSPPRTPPSSPPLSPPRLPPYSPKPEFSSQYQGPQPAFDVYVRESSPKGKSKVSSVKVNKKPLPVNAAKNLGSYYADNTTSRTFILKKRGQTRKADELLMNPEYKFRTPKGKTKLESGSYVEKNAFLIDTSGEYEGLTVKALKALREKQRKNGGGIFAI